MSPERTRYELKRIPRWRVVVFPIVAPLVALLVRLYWRSCRIRVVAGQEHLDALARAGRPIIPCYWHGRQLFCAAYLFRRRRRDFTFGALVSPSRDGELGAQLLRRLGARPVRGSDRRTGAQAMRELYLAIKQEGISPVMTPDGSKGPVHVFKPGPVMVAQLSGAPMVPLTSAARHAWRMKSWDRFLVPLPFTRVVIAVGAPVEVPRAGKLGDPAEYQRRMEEALGALEEIAAAALG
jgi:lysophospholipid acyltransferase (LPLAT)-like uncharacterized protein